MIVMWPGIARTPLHHDCVSYLSRLVESLRFGFFGWLFLCLRGESIKCFISLSFQVSYLVLKLGDLG